MAQMPAQTRKQYTKGQALDWFRGLFRTPFNLRKQIMTGDNGSRYRSTVQIGSLYAYYYDPLHKDKLPVYDRFPLVFPIEFYKNGFLGLNLHYLSAGQRGALLDMLMRYANNQALDETTRLQLSWDAVTATSRMKNLSKRCVKRYLYDHVRSRYIKINADEWDKVASLPTADFVYKDKS